MKPFSLFNNRAYLVDSATRNDPIDKEALGKILKESGIEGPISGTKSIYEGGDYDGYEIELKNGTRWRVKISLDAKTPLLKREATVLKNSAGVATGKLHLLSDYTLGEKTPHLIFQFPPALDVYDLGKSFLLKERRLLFRSYFALLQTLSPKRQYKSVLEENFKKLNIPKSFPAISRDAIKNNSNYPLFLDFFATLRKETREKLPPVPTGKKCLGGLPLGGIFYSKWLFFFDYLHNTCLHHPFVDFVDFILDFGADPETEGIFFEDFCELGAFGVWEEQLYKDVYNILLRKKLADLVGQYLIEVYMFESRRIDNLVHLADNFSLCAERFRRIPAFLNNQDFLVKTITEPILGIKPDSS